MMVSFCKYFYAALYHYNIVLLTIGLGYRAMLVYRKLAHSFQPLHSVFHSIQKQIYLAISRLMTIVYLLLAHVSFPTWISVPNFHR